MDVSYIQMVLVYGAYVGKEMEQLMHMGCLLQLFSNWLYWSKNVLNEYMNACIHSIAYIGYITGLL